MRSKKKEGKSELEKIFAAHIENDGLPIPHQEHEFTDLAKYRFDFAWPDQMVAAEIEGGTWAGGRHVTGKGFENDCMKYNVAALEGWRVFRFTGDMVRNGYARRIMGLVFRRADSAAG